jgi:16S rRNA (guanine966-N2)-methyltransferase
VAALAAGSPDVQVLPVKAEAAAAVLAGQGSVRPTFDVVLADPPYDMAADRLASVLANLGVAGLVAAGAVFAVERRAHEDWTWPTGIEAVRDRRYGDTRVWYGLW